MLPTPWVAWTLPPPALWPSACKGASPGPPATEAGGRGWQLRGLCLADGTHLGGTPPQPHQRRWGLGGHRDGVTSLEGSRSHRSLSVSPLPLAAPLTCQGQTLSGPLPWTALPAMPTGSRPSSSLSWGTREPLQTSPSCQDRRRVPSTDAPRKVPGTIGTDKPLQDPGGVNSASE